MKHRSRLAYAILVSLAALTGCESNSQSTSAAGSGEGDQVRTFAGNAIIAGSDRPHTEIAPRAGSARGSVTGAEGLYVSLPEAAEPWRYDGRVDSFAIDVEGTQSFADAAPQDRFDGPERPTRFSFVARQREIVELLFTRAPRSWRVTADLR